MLSVPVALAAVNFFQERGGGILFLGGIYRDRFTAVDREWRISHRVLEVQWRHDTATGRTSGPS